MFNFEVDNTIIIEVFGYKPSRPAPACNNPSSPAFSDCGDDPEWSDVKFYYGDNKVQITDEKFCEYLEDLFFDEIIAIGEEQCTD